MNSAITVKQINKSHVCVRHNSASAQRRTLLYTVSPCDGTERRPRAMGVNPMQWVCHVTPWKGSAMREVCSRVKRSQLWIGCNDSYSPLRSVLS